MREGLLALTTALGLLAGGAPSAASIEAFLGEAEDVPIVILGEIHDNPWHHANQAAIVAALQPAALVFEMIPQEREAEVNELRAEGATHEAIAEALAWEKSGWPDFGHYAAILDAAPEARIFGAGQPSADVRRAMVEGAAGPFGPDAAIYGLDQPLEPEEQELREARMAAGHCDLLPDEVLPGMVEAQRFRDAGLADATLWARTMTGGGQIVVITGNGHADLERGMPQALRIADPEAAIIALGQFEAEPPADEELPYDHVLVTDAPQRPDPCEALLDD
ncbi:ChaN family lipoprotein [soil metagenome]